MVTLRYKFKEGPSKGKWFAEETRTEAEAKRAKKFIGKSAEVEIIRHRKKPKTTTYNFGLDAKKLMNIKL